MFFSITEATLDIHAHITLTRLMPAFKCGHLYILVEYTTIHLLTLYQYPEYMTCTIALLYNVIVSMGHGALSFDLWNQRDFGRSLYKDLVNAHVG